MSRTNNDTPAGNPTSTIVPATLDTLAPSTALLRLYQQLPGDVVNLCEQHRIAIIGDTLEHLRAIRDALAPHGLFQDWCRAAGVNYNTALVGLSRHYGNRTAVQSTAGSLVGGQKDGRTPPDLVGLLPRGAKRVPGPLFTPSRDEQDE